MTALVNGEYTWQHDITTIMAFMDNQLNELSGTKFIIDDCTFYLKLARWNNKNPILCLHLFALPPIYGAVEIEAKIQCDQIKYESIVSATSITTERLENELNRYEHIIYFHDPIPLYALRQTQDTSLSESTSVKTLKIKCNIKILKYYDFEGYEVNPHAKPLIKQATADDKLLVFGYINMLNIFIPNNISKMIYDYYLRILYIDNYNNDKNEYFAWNFTTDEDVQLFINAKPNDVITSCYFSINGFVFYLECTPNGWSDCVQEGEASIWCALYRLPNENISSIEMNFHCVCKEALYADVDIQRLTTPDLSLKVDQAYSMAPGQNINTAYLMNQKSFSFLCAVKVLKIYDFDGHEMDL
eukprot:153724_1